MVQDFSLRSPSELGGMERRLDDYRESSLTTNSIAHKSKSGALRNFTGNGNEDLQPLKSTAENCARACTAGSGAKRQGYTKSAISLDNYLRRE